MDNKKWFKEAKFGMMIHWGLYSLPAGEWKGKRMPEDVAEWIMSKFRIPISEYEELCKAFNPIYFNAEEWVLLAKEAGMNYIVFTSKHHDGFAMYKSEADKYNIYDATPFRRDVLAELAAACKKHGMKLGLYYSQELDWHEKHGGGRNMSSDTDKCSWTNNWDFPDDKEKDYSITFENKIIPQVKEILTNYGEISLIWFDCPMDIIPEHSRRLNELVKSLQPNCLINSRIGNGAHDYVSFGDNEIPDTYYEGLCESACTLNDTWGYKSYDDNWKSAEKLIETKNHLNERGINYLLNVGPDYLGRIPAPSADILREFGKKNK